MYYPDLTPYSYLRDKVAALPEDYTLPENAPSVLNVGWLEPPNPFPIGEVSERFLDHLFALCQRRVNQTRGIHVCPFCSIPTLQIVRKEQRAWLGTAEMRVRDKLGTVYAAPDMIYHYVAAHSYLPPASFIEAVLETNIEATDPL